MARTMIRKRVKAPRKKDKEPGIIERLNKLTADVPVAKIRGKSFILVKGDETNKPEEK